MPAATELFLKGRYRVESSLSENGNGALLQAYDTTGNSKVLVKEIMVRLGKVTTLSQQENLKNAFTNLATTLTGISHNTLPKVSDFFAEVGRQYLVMECPEGEDLQSLTTKNGKPFPFEKVAEWGDQLLDALHYLHGLSPAVIHSKIRPRHILLSDDGSHIKLFGHGVSDGTTQSLSTLFDDNARHADLNFSPLEAIWDGLDAASQKVIVNSYDDASERVLKQPLDARSDLYSLGATLYFLMTATVPVDPLERSIELLEGHDDPLKPPSSIDPSIPGEISDMVMRSLSIRRENRFDSAMIMRQVMRTALVRIRENGGVSAQPSSAQAETKEPVKTPAAAQEPAKMPPVVEAKDETARLAEKLREVEEQRKAAERRAAEAERLLREKELAAQNTMQNFLPEDDLLGLISSDAPNASPAASFGTPSSSDDSPLASVIASDLPSTDSTMAEAGPTVEPLLQEISQEQNFAAEEGSVTMPVAEDLLAENISLEENAAPQTIDAAEEYEAEPVVATYAEASVPEAPIHFEHTSLVDDNDHFQGFQNENARKLPMTAIAGAGALLLLLFVGAWYFLFSGPSQPSVADKPETPVVSEESQQPPSQQVSTFSEPAAQQNALQPQAESSPEIQTAVSSDTVKDNKPAAEQKQAAKVNTPKPVKPAAQPSPEKKKVTVDDLINDN